MQSTEQEVGDPAGEEVALSEVSGASNSGARRRRWSDEEKAWIVQESYEPGATVAKVAKRHGVSPRQLSQWRTQARKSESVAPPAAEFEGAFAQIALESSSPDQVGSVSIESRGVTVRLDGEVSIAQITLIATALRGIRG